MKKFLFFLSFSVMAYFLISVAFGSEVFAATESTSKIKQSCVGETGLCYTSLSDWEAAYGGINFGACAEGNLVCADKIAIAKIEGIWTAPDTNDLIINDWITGPNNYIKIYTSPEARHKGVLKSNGSYTGYTLKTISGSSIRSYEEYVKIDGVAIDNTSAGAYDSAFRMSVNNDVSENIISNSIIKRTNGGSTYGAVSKDFYYGRYKVINSVVYVDKIPAAAIRGSGSSNYVEVYNSTVYGAGVNIGIKSAVSKNNIAANFSQNFSGGSGDYNCSTDSTAPGANSLKNQTISQIAFKSLDSQIEDFHLETNSVCVNKAQTLAIFSDDIDSQIRMGQWDIGADETIAAVSDTPAPVADETGAAPPAVSNEVVADIKNQIIPIPASDNPCSGINILCVDDTAGPFQEYSSIQSAADAIKPGDTVYVYDGAYQGFQASVSGTRNSPISFKAYGDNVIIDKGGITGDGVRIQNASYIKIEGLKIKNVSERCIAARGAAPNFPMQEIIIANNTCDNAGMEGFYLSELANSRIENNIIKNSGAARAARNHGIYLANSGSDNTVIKGNVVSGAKGSGSEGVHINADLSVGGDGIISNLIVENNIISDNATNGFSLDGVQDSLIQNNIVYGNSRHAFRGYKGDGAAGPKNLKIINNTFLAETNGWSLKLSEDLGGHMIFNNILFTDSAADGSISVSNSNFKSNYNALTNRFSADNGLTVVSLTKFQSLGYDKNSFLSSASIFVNPLLNDYHIKNGSAAADNGTNILNFVSAPSFDISGIQRPQGLKYDIGAYEILSSVVYDTNSPLILSGTPTGALPAGTVNTTISVSTNENAICKYSTIPNTSYTLITGVFGATGGLNHSQNISGLSDGNSYNYYIKCADLLNNQNISDFQISFSVASVPVASNKFKTGDAVKTTDNLNVRSSAGIAGTLLGTQPLGSKGSIIAGPVSANGYIWWQVDYVNAPDGWSIEDWLAKAIVPAESDTYYISPDGNDLNSGTASAPFKTFKHTFSKMKSGGILIVKDGVYNQAFGEWKWQNNVKIPISAPPSGTAEKYTIVKAENVRAIVDKIQIIGSSYIKIEGFKSLSKVSIDGSNHIIVKKIAAKGGFTTARSSYITKEDIWSWNDNRYVIHNYKSDHIIDNRVIARLDDLGTMPDLPVGAISHYLTNNSVIANALLFDVSGTFQQPYDLVYSSRPNIGSDQIIGLIGFNAGSQLGGIYPADGGGSNYEVRNSVIWGTPKRCIRFNAASPLKVINNTCGENGDSAVSTNNSPVEIKNNIFYNNGGGAGGPVSVCDNNIFYNSGIIPSACANTSIINPGIKWLPRSPIPGKGANIEKKYKITETSGKFTAMETNENLWPWPYEDLIKQDMCEGVTKGWCGTNKTLSKYIWEYLGNVIPPEIYSTSK